MSIVNTLGKSEFMDLLQHDDYANWSYDAAGALFDYYDELSDSLGEPVEFDRVAIRCDWSEHDSLADAYSDHESDALGDDDAMRAYFEDHTTLIELDNGHVLVEAF